MSASILFNFDVTFFLFQLALKTFLFALALFAYIHVLTRCDCSPNVLTPNDAWPKSKLTAKALRQVC